MILNGRARKILPGLAFGFSLAAYAGIALAAEPAPTPAPDQKKATKTERVIIMRNGEGGMTEMHDMTGFPGMPPMPPMPPMPGGEHGVKMFMMHGGHMGEGFGPQMIYGSPGRAKPATVDEVKTWLSKMLERDGNPRLRLGTVKDKDAGTIEAVIETVDGSLVQKLSINKEFWFARRVD